MDERTEKNSDGAPHGEASASEEPARRDDAQAAAEQGEHPMAPGPSPRPGVLAAETFGIAAIVMSGAALIGTRLVEMLASVTAADQSAAVSGVILGDGITALCGVLLGIVGLARTDAASRPWARWLAGAAIVTGALALITAGAAYMLVPPPAPMPPMQ
ncbi:hypothetical protein HDA32_001359 [Spinactinospora alkalitolerans]|uniref:Uncharacterized protein n=1 Tax=Spinactinospora alkalitolerans TaxID=687207 RepID=A0A852TQJ0_9ACTN|nr:hypothetical protein [Spinactinospora alkalitolerans]NYE46239.1 hypothetical protein [Spinactinospora alkalitolerans]